MKAIFKKTAVFAIAIVLVLLMSLSVMPVISATEGDPALITHKTENGEVDLGETLKAMNISLSGQITMKFYFTEIGDDHSYVKITVPQQNAEDKVITVSKSSLVEENGRYAVEVPVAAAQQTDLVTLQWFNAAGKSGKLRQYSVKYYADKIIELAKTDETYAPMVQPVKSMLNYGAMAQAVFGYNTNKLANQGLYTAENNPINGMLAEHLYDALPNTVEDKTVITGVQLFLQDSIRMRIYVNAPEGASATVNNTPVSIKNDENGSYISIYNIPASMFAEQFDIAVTVGDKTATAKYSVLGWCLDTLNGYKIDDATKNIAKSLYLYYTWMKDYLEDSYAPGEEDCQHHRYHTENGDTLCSDCGVSVSEKTRLSLNADKVALVAGVPTDVTFTVSVANAADLNDFSISLVSAEDSGISLTYKEGSAQFIAPVTEVTVALNILVEVDSSIFGSCDIVTVTYTATAEKSGTYTIIPVIREALNSADEYITDSIISSGVNVEVKNADCGKATGYEIDGDMHRYYCDDCKNVGEWEAHTPEWTIDVNDPQYENSVCSACKVALGKRATTANSEGLLLFNHELIKNKAGDKGQIMTENGMSFTRLSPENTTGTEYILLHADKAKPYTNVGGYIAILYRSSLKQQLLTSCNTDKNTTAEGSVQSLPQPQCVGEWIFMVQPVKDHAAYDGESLATFALYPFAVSRTASDYTDVAFVSFFSSVDDAWSYYDTYKDAYGLTAQYFGNVNGNTNIDETSLGSYTISNSPITINCNGKTLTNASSLHFGGWFATPGGNKEYGYYVVDGGNKSAYTYIYTGTNANVSGSIPNKYPDSYSSGVNVAPTNPKGATINLSAYAGKTVTVIAVAKTNHGDEIELVSFTNVTVPCDHTNNTADWQINPAAPQYEISNCSACGEKLERLAVQTSEGTLLFNHQFINNKTSASNLTAEIKNDGPGGMSYIRFNPVAETGNKNVLLYADKVNKIENLGEYIAILYRTSVEQNIALILDSENNAIRGGQQKFGTTKSATQWKFAVNKVSANQYYNTAELSAAAFFPFIVDRSLTDYTDVAFIAFFSSEAEALEYFAMYQQAYGIPDNSSTEYYFNLNGNTKVDDSKFTNVLQANKPATYNCSDKTLSTTTSLKFGGWFATPEGIKEYGYYVIDGSNISSYNKLLTASTSTNSGVLAEVQKKFNWDINCTKGSAIGSPTPIDLSAYAGKTVTVVVVAKTNLGAEIELVYFENVSVPSAQ